ncbi:hypothetical protein [Paraburkholderia sp. HD33-4]|uniref:hypothetical protein n=1 Tax=Paraburkholderia sp. HD33-4 TaxID=2883242 RepID=UPI001F2DDFC0|nr:hypothetical protein [Paraburkholderia sp. HD33-4]
MSRRLIRADGTETPIPLPMTIREVADLIGATTLDSVNLAHGEVMILDDLGCERGLPVNATATAMYHARCVPGTTWPILGDVVIAPDADFAPAAGPLERHSG